MIDMLAVLMPLMSEKDQQKFVRDALIVTIVECLAVVGFAAWFTYRLW